MDDKARAEALGLTVDQFQALVGEDPMEAFNDTFAVDAAKHFKPKDKDKEDKGDKKGDKKKPNGFPPKKSPK